MIYGKNNNINISYYITMQHIDRYSVCSYGTNGALQHESVTNVMKLQCAYTTE